MRSARDLTLAYLESHPDDAGRVLERLSTEDAIALLATLPVRLSAPVIRQMLAPHAARCLETLPLDATAGIVAALGAQSGAAVLRYLSPARRSGVLEQLPTSSVVALRLVLGYPEDTVGAWMDPQAPAFAPDTPIKTVTERLREIETTVNYVYVVTPDHRLQGSVSLSAVLRAGPKLTLAQLMQPAHYALPARASITAVQRHDGWRHAHALPVVEQHDRFIGVLNYTALLQTNRQPRSRFPGMMNGVLAGVGSSYWRAFSGLVQFVVFVLISTTQAPENREDSHGK